MAFDDIPRTTSADSRYLGEGFRQEPDFREATTVAGVPPEPLEDEATVRMVKRVSPPNLDYVFDDPAEGEPGRDRMLVHGLWELLLAVAVAAVGYLLYREQPATLSGPGLHALLLDITAVGILAAACAVSLRAGVPNLAAGSVAIAAGLYFAQHSGGGLATPLLVVVGLCALIGAVQGLVVVGLQVPSWAVSLAAGLVVFIWVRRQGTITITGGYDPTPHAYWWFGGFFAVSVVASLLGLFSSVRRAFGRFRPVADPAQRRGVVAALIAFGALVVSAALAATSGVLAASASHTAEPSDGLVLTAIGMGVALAGGTSAYGRRGGILGTVLAAIVYLLVVRYSESVGQHWPAAGFAVGALLLGLGVTRLVERFGRPFIGVEQEIEEEEWVLPGGGAPVDTGWVAGTAAGTSVAATTQTQTQAQARAWQAVEPASPAGLGGIWTPDQTWGSSNRAR
jgi:ribose/xylose/arabinose/galactoside ABC-type transport system permease subunit